MKPLIITAKYGRDFTHNRLPKLFLNLIFSELKKPTSITMLTYIRDNYDLNFTQLAALLKNNLRISIYVDTAVITFNNIKIKEEIIEDRIITTYLQTIIDLIDYGNIDVRGCNIFTKIINYIKANIIPLYRLHKLRRNSPIWQ